MADDKLIFVGGCMRTGTTILHRVLCSSPAAHPYITESWYLLDQLRIYVWSLRRYDVRQRIISARRRISTNSPATS